MAEQILSQNEIDALLAAVNEGELELDEETDSGRESSSDAAAFAVKYDLLSQDRIIRGRMPTLDIINDRFARQFRITLSNSLRKIVQVNVESTSLMKYGEFLNYLPIPSCLNLMKLNPLRGSSILAIESKLIYAFLNNWFGGATNAQERIESRDFTAIELMVIKRVIDFLTSELESAWQPVHPIQCKYVRTEVNPQFLAVIAPSDVVVLTSYEIEIDGLRGSVQLVIPYSSIEPIRQHLSRGIGADAEGDDNAWRNLLTESLNDVQTRSQVILGTSRITIRDLLKLKPGEIITLGTNRTDTLDFIVQKSKKFEVVPMEQSGYLAGKITKDIPPRLPDALTFLKIDNEDETGDEDDDI
ncbi:MAG: flagellar motor switch protein FliM [Myxococcota bacterium]|nr:flagellar motor switch protein FliM [Myxococcota bacterium]